jgi:hypothetical protein
MHLIIIMLIVVAAALVGARMLPDEAGVVRVVRWALFAIAGAALLLLILTIAAALFE